MSGPPHQLSPASIFSAENTDMTHKKGLNEISVCISDYFWSHVLAFSSNLDDLNPGVSEWREDIGRVVKSSMVQVSSAAASSFHKD